MSNAPLCRFDGAVARLFPGTNASLAVGPGGLGRGGAAAVMLFAAGDAIWTDDLFAGFWRDEAGGMDWRTDFKCDPAFDHMLDILASPPEEDEEPEEMYARNQLATLGSEIMDEY
jgi:hypothetical protein